MKYVDGQYLLICGFDLCGCEFFGRQNQVYCSPKCKQAFNNRKARIINKATKGTELKIKKAVRILLGVFRADREGKFVISKVELITRSFPFDLPTSRIKDDRYNGIMHSIGSFCFYEQDGNFIFYKI
jgi:hypothetical protein